MIKPLHIFIGLLIVGGAITIGVIAYRRNKSNGEK
jgi:hypothetical protein